MVIPVVARELTSARYWLSLLSREYVELVSPAVVRPANEPSCAH